MSGRARGRCGAHFRDPALGNPMRCEKPRGHGEDHQSGPYVWHNKAPDAYPDVAPPPAAREMTPTHWETLAQDTSRFLANARAEIEEWRRVSGMQTPGALSGYLGGRTVSEEVARHDAAGAPKPSLNVTLAGLGLSAKPSANGRKGILSDDGCEWFEGTAHEVSALLLAAPEMLDVLGRLLGFIEESATDCREHALLIDQANAVISKAQGRS